MAAMPSFLLFGHDSGLLTVGLWTLLAGALLFWVTWHVKRGVCCRQSKEEADRQAARVQQILRHSRETLFGIDLRTGQFDYLSASCLGLTGYTANEIQSLGLAGLFERVHPEDRSELEQVIQKIRARPEGSEWSGLVEYRVLHRDGQYRCFSDYLHVAYDESGVPVWLRGSVRDVTRIARLEESLRTIEKRFYDSQKLAGLGLLAGSVAHDFNNLMTVVVGNVDMALLDHSGKDAAVLEEVKRASLRAAELANQMLVYTGRSDSVTCNVNIGLVVREMAALLDVSISKKVVIQYCIDEDVHPVCGDVSQIRQVVMNLITNASEAIGDCPGVIAISVRNAHVKEGQVSRAMPEGGMPAGEYVRLEISDTGKGMDEETRKRIFDPMFTTKITGRGLGLVSLLSVVERHKGSVEVESKPGQGTVFRVWFPVADKGLRQPLEIDDLPEDDGWRGYGVALVADDEPAICQIVAALLSRYGFRVLTARDGLELLDLYTENAGEITLVVTDLAMPCLDGVEAIMRIRYITPRIPVLLMSGEFRPQVVERFCHQPHTAFLKKPFLVAELCAGVRSVMTAVRDRF